MLISTYLLAFRTTNGPDGKPWASKVSQRKYELAFLCPKLNFGLNAWAEKSNGASWLVSLFRRASGADQFDVNAQIHPDDIEAVCDSMGITTVEQLASLAEACNIINPSKFWATQSSNVTIDYDSLPSATFGDLLRCVQTSLVTLKEGLRTHATDNVYKLLTDEALNVLLQACPSKRYAWRAERLDCDDASRIFRGWLSTLGLGNLAIGYVEFACMDANNVSVAAHAVLVAVMTDGRALLIEPQTGEIMPADYVIGPGAVSNLIYLLEF